MTKNPQTDQVGDSKTPSLQPDAGGLRHGADQAMTLQSDITPAFAMRGPLSSAVPGQLDAQTPPGDCKQTVWLSFFFDGTGNNMDADVGTDKHSNVAKLYRVHAENDLQKGIYRIYIPGVGTYFKEVGDDGGSALGLGTGSKGDARLDWALKEFDAKMAPHISRANSPSTRILEVNVAVFGFSRGAALARAFVNRLLEHRGKRLAEREWKMNNVDCPLRVRFLGLFDTVASVGMPMSGNNIGKIAALVGLRAMIDTRLIDPDFAASRPEVLAFAEGALPGADPAPGIFDGHASWGGELAIPEMVEEVRHFVAAHELRNSFPVDSITRMVEGRAVKPAHFYESVYPGVHSDVGGSYRPGEGGRHVEPEEKLGLIPLRQMYEFAIAQKVPLLPETAWRDGNRADFAIGQQVQELYRHYMQQVPQVPILGPTLNAHMRLYYAWRFREIRRKAGGDKRESANIDQAGRQFNAERAQLETSIRKLEEENNKARRALNIAQQKRLNYLRSNYGNPDLPALPELEDQVAQANRTQALTRDALLREKAKLDALPQMDGLADMVAYYDARLLADARAIRRAYTESPGFGAPPVARFADLRPHYMAMMEAYEDEYIRNAGLADEAIVAFFDNYVHDSLSGFAKDATLPSDPRVVYLGGDEKYRYALRGRTGEEMERAYARAGHGAEEGIADAV